VSSWGIKMVAHLLQLVTEYEECRRKKQYVPRFLYGRRMLRDDGGPNRFFLMYLFSVQAMAVEFINDIGLLRNKVQCNTCGRDVTWSADSNLPEGLRWRSKRRVAGVRCNCTYLGLLCSKPRYVQFQIHITYKH